MRVIILQPVKYLAIFALLAILRLASAQNTTESLPTFGDTIQILGLMDRTDQDFQDGLALDLLSPKNRTLVVTQNTQPLSGQFVSGTTGGPFVALSSYSYIIKMNETANDLIAKIEIPYDGATLSSMGVQESNTYVGKLAPDGRSWMIDEMRRNIHRSENNTRIIKMTSLEGEYMLLGRQTTDTGNIFVQYGQGATRTINMTGGSGIQQAEFIDGLRFSVDTPSALSMNAEIRNGVDPAKLPSAAQSLNTYSWVVNTSDSSIQTNTEIRFPFNKDVLASLKPKGGSPSTMIMVAFRAANDTAAMFRTLLPDSQIVKEASEDRIVVSGVSRLDGEYVILVTDPQLVN